MKNNFFFYLTLFSLTLFSSCETLDLDQIENPSSVSSKFIDPIYTFNFVQLELPKFVNSANSFTQRVTRQMAMTGGNTYDNAFAAVNSNTNWSDGFIILNAIKLMESKAVENKQYYELGASKLIRAYIVCTLVDLYGDIPFTQSLLGNENLTPKYDSSASVYKQILLDIDEAILILGRTDTNSKAVQDLYYSGTAQWITMANTLKLKMLLNSKLAGNEIGVPSVGTAINAIVTSGNYIDVPSKDFAFKYGNSRFSPNTRHPLYNDQYEIGGGAYICNYFMWAMTMEKGVTPDTSKNPTLKDPRTALYFYKQEDDIPSNDDFVLPKLSRPIHYSNSEYSSFFDALCLSPYKVSNWIGQNTINNGGFWGRDHGDNSGTPLDNDKRTVAGVYPIGGKYNPTTAASVQNSGSDGKKGEGIMPIILSSYVHFMISEAILTTGVSGNAKSEFLLGINQSIDKSLSAMDNYPTINIKNDKPYANNAEGIIPIGGYIDSNGNLNTAPLNNFSTYYKININERKTYVDFVSDFYETLSATKKLELIVKEYYLASWGNGIEPYNNYRRTGYPSNFQPTLEFSETPFYYTALYPGTAVNNNPNTPNNDRTRKVFWDKANIILH
jgi:hypothetical protein